MGAYSDWLRSSETTRRRLEKQVERQRELIRKLEHSLNPDRIVVLKNGEDAKLGDIVRVVRSQVRLTPERTKELRRKAEAQFPGDFVVILDESLEVAVSTV